MRPGATKTITIIAVTEYADVNVTLKSDRLVAPSSSAASGNKPRAAFGVFFSVIFQAPLPAGRRGFFHPRYPALPAEPSLFNRH